MSKLSTLVWFLKRPSYWGQIWPLFKVKYLNQNKENTRAVSERWCSDFAIEDYAVVNKIFGKMPVNIESEFTSIFSESRKTVSSLPVKMGGEGAIGLLYNLALYSSAFKIIETGVANGWSSLSLLLAISKNDPDNGLLISTDMPYVNMGNEDFVGCAVPDFLRKNWKLIRLADRQGLPKALSEMPQIDLCHYDSDKSYQGRMWAYPKLWKALKPGGIFVSDDIGDNIAFKEFAEKINVKPIVVKFKSQYVGVLIKP